MQPGLAGIVGRILGGYHLERVIGIGGMGAVLLGRAPGDPATVVAVKILLPPWQASAEDRALYRRRFLREARVMRDLRHPHILPVFAAGEEEGMAFMVMPFAAGGSLAAKIAGQLAPLPFPAILELLAQLADAIDYAHGQGLIHRDIKPANVLLDATGNVLLADFGITRVFDGTQTALTSTGDVLGTPNYIAPEQARGQDITPAADLYSLGILTYELIVGHVPFSAATPFEVMMQHLSDPPPSPRVQRPELSPAAEVLLLQMLAKDPAHRPDSAMAFVKAFTAAIQPPAIPLWAANVTIAPALPDPTLGGHNSPPPMPWNGPISTPPLDDDTALHHIASTLVGSTPPLARPNTLPHSLANGTTETFPGIPARRSRIAIIAALVLVLAVSTLGGIALASRANTTGTAITGGSSRASGPSATATYSFTLLPTYTPGPPLPTATPPPTTPSIPPSNPYTAVRYANPPPCNDPRITGPQNSGITCVPSGTQFTKPAKFGSAGFVLHSLVNSTLLATTFTTSLDIAGLPANGCVALYNFNSDGYSKGSSAGAYVELCGDGKWDLHQYGSNANPNGYASLKSGTVGPYATFTLQMSYTGNVVGIAINGMTLGTASVLPCAPISIYLNLRATTYTDNVEFTVTTKNFAYLPSR